jgi:dTDP-3-amino-3,4,6-trideoxy-alpha-D-glucose transaminase
MAQRCQKRVVILDPRDDTWKSRLALRDDFGLSMVEDCAQSIGACWGTRKTGSVGRLAATSFYPIKNLDALGDGRAILTDSGALSQEAGALRDYGQSRKYYHDRMGWNSRLDELQAAILRRVLLPKLAEWTRLRRKTAGRYLSGIANPAVRPAGAPEGAQSCWHPFPVRVDAERKTEFMAHPQRSGIATAEHYPRALMDQPVMAGLHHEVVGECREARRFCREEVSLPIHPFLTDSEIDQVIAACNCWGR